MEIDRSHRSPHHKNRTSPILGVVLHYTAGASAKSTIAWFCHDASKVSAHYAISRKGLVFELVSPHLKAYHAGVGEMEIAGEMQSDPNDFTIGIELANHGWLYRDQHGKYWWETSRGMNRYDGPEPQEATLVYDDGTQFEGFWEPYPEAQLAALEQLLKELAQANVVGHEEIAMPLGRKRDPGPLFPWERFERETARRTRALLELPMPEDDSPELSLLSTSPAEVDCSDGSESG